ncbi:MAG: hydrogenase nickel incorporation protein HypB [Candidatus Latescibacterota bacterium]
MKIIEAAEGEVFDIELEEDLLRKNRELAEANRALLDEHGIFAVDIMGSVGSGKTTLIGQIVRRLKGKHRIAALAGDLTTTIDADRIEVHGASVIEINTGKECHLDANLVRKGIAELCLDEVDVLIIENVGNLICPGEFPLGAHKRMVIISVTEGPYMVVKHPYIFMDADVVAINKIDLSEAMSVNPEQLEKDALGVKPSLKVVWTNGLTGEGVDAIVEALLPT